MLIADLPLERRGLSFMWDAFCSFLIGVRLGYAQALLRAAFERRFRQLEYKKFYDKSGQLCFTINRLKSLISRLNLNSKIVKGRFSIYANRPGLLIQF